MNEVKTPKKPFIFYYVIVMLVLLLLNLLVMPRMLQAQIIEVDYGTFMDMTEKKDIGQVEIQDNQILFTNKDNTQIYKTGLMDDPGRTERLYESGAKFSSEIVEQASPIVSFLISWVLPIVIFVAIGQWMYKRTMNKIGGDSMMFGMGKSNAKGYVKSSAGIRFSDVAGAGGAGEKPAPETT